MGELKEYYLPDTNYEICRTRKEGTKIKVYYKNRYVTDIKFLPKTTDAMIEYTIKLMSTAYTLGRSSIVTELKKTLKIDIEHSYL